MVGKSLGHYRILEEIGAGGMGVVYRAHDEHLNRDVAVKVLPSEKLSDESAARRFRKEAEALSKLNHPNIATVYDFDAEGDVVFLAMELVSGPTLVERLGGGALEEKDVARLGMQLAEALDAAHARNVVHRDLKPSNLRLTPDGRLKVLDFGLARLLEVAPDTQQTLSAATQGVMGTPPYMSPEQVRAEAPDARSDIYAAGAVLYELATGQMAFPEKVSTRLVSDILHRAPVAPRAVNSRVSPELERILMKCLEKDAENRYQSAKELLVDLRRLGTPAIAGAAPAAAATGRETNRRWMGLAAGALALIVLAAGAVYWRGRANIAASASRIDSLAVLPLANLSGDPDQEYFADGMTEEFITGLGKISTLRVISRTSVMRYKNTSEPLAQIARELNVAAVLEGSVLRSGERVRITVQLIRAGDERQLWSERYEGSLRDVLGLQQQVADGVAREIRRNIATADQARISGGHHMSPEAYEAYLRGRYFWRQFNRPANEKAIGYFQKAIAADPNSALGYAGLAASYALGGVGGGRIAPNEGMPKAKAAAEKALELDDSLAEAHLALALVFTFYDWDWPAAETEFQKALTLNPNDSETHHFHSHYFMTLGRIQESLGESLRALELDPLSGDIAWHLGWHYYFARENQKAIAHLAKALELDPNNPQPHSFLGWAYEASQQYPEAIAEMERVQQLLPHSPFALGQLGHVYAVSGRKREALGVLQELGEAWKRQPEGAYNSALVCAGLGDRSQAFLWLERAYQEHSTALSYLKTDPRMDPLRPDARFKSLLRRLNHPE